LITSNQTLIIIHSNAAQCPFLLKDITVENCTVMMCHKVCIWVILLNLVLTENLQFLAIFHNLAANEQGFLSNKYT